MSINKQNPLSIKALGTLSGKSIEEQVNKLYKDIVEGEDSRTSWLAKQEKLIRQRRGVRKKKIFPWPGANNHNWPLTDGIIRRWKPNVVSLVLQANPVAYFFPMNPEAVKVAPDAQAYYHWRFHSMHNVRNAVMELADYTAQHGTAYTRQGWDYRTRQMCRVIDIEQLFPDGIAAAVQRWNEGAAQMRKDTEQGIASGEVAPEAMDAIPDETTEPQMLRDTIMDEYGIDPERSENEAAQVEEIVKKVIDEGARQVKIYYNTVIRSQPGMTAITPLNVTVPPRCTDISDAEYIALEYRMRPDEIIGMALDEIFNYDLAAELVKKIESKSAQTSDITDAKLGTTASRSTVFQLMDQSDGLKPYQTNDKRTSILEIFCKLDIEGEGILQKCVLWYHPDSKTILSLAPYAYPFEEWPIVRFQFEHNSDRPYESRGIAELCSVFQAQMNKLHNARLDAIQVTLCPMFQMRVLGQEQNRSIRFMPGSIIPVTNVGDIAPLPTDVRPLAQLLQEENYTKMLAEQYIGIFDPGVMAQNAAERRTATEVEAVMSQTQSIFGQDAALFQSSMQQVHRQLWALEQEFGDPHTYYRVIGEEQPKLATKSELNKHYDIVPAGTPANTSKQLAMARSREALQLFIPDQTGLINKHELYKWYFDVLDRNMGKLILRSPEQAAAIQQVMQVLVNQAEMTGEKPQLPAVP